MIIIRRFFSFFHSSLHLCFSSSVSTSFDVLRRADVAMVLSPHWLLGSGGGLAAAASWGTCHPLPGHKSCSVTTFFNLHLNFLCSAFAQECFHLCWDVSLLVIFAGGRCLVWIQEGSWRVGCEGLLGLLCCDLSEPQIQHWCWSKPCSVSGCGAL